MTTTAATLARALQFHEAGQLQQAEQLYRQILQADPAHVDALHLLGTVALHEGKLETAIEHIQRALQLQPTFAAAHNNLGIALAQHGQLAEAAASFRQAIAHDPEYVEAHNNLGLALARQHHYAEAIASYHEALRLDPQHVEGHYHLGLALRAQGQHEQASASFRQVVRLQPHHAAAHNDLGNALADQGRPDEAIVCYQQALRLRSDFVEAYRNLGMVLQRQGRLELAIASLREAVRFRPDAVSHSALGSALGALGRWAEAEACFRQALQVNPNSAGAHLGLGVALDRQGRPAEAIHSYQQALHLQPDSAETHARLGLALRKMGRLDEALASYQQALQLQPDQAAAHAGRGSVLRAQGQLDEASASYRRALQLQPESAEVHNNLGNLLWEQRQYDEARACFQEAVRLEPDSADARNNLGNALRAQGRLDDAVAEYRQAVRLRPDFALAHHNLGQALAELGQWEAAAASCHEALRLRPDLIEAYHTLGSARRQQGRADEALAIVREALRRQPAYAQGHSDLAGLLREEGRMGEAENHYQQALRLQPTTGVRLQRATMLPPIYQSLDDLHTWRRRLIDNVQQLREARVCLDLMEETAEPPCLLAAQGLNDRDLRSALAGLYTAPEEPARSGSTNRGVKNKIGLVWSARPPHSAGSWLRRLLPQLSREHFAITLCTVGRTADSVANTLREATDAAIEITVPLPAARRLMAQQGFDVLIYTDLDSDPLSYTLAFSRLAPVQCVTWHQRVSTGIPTLDYFLSSDLLETAESEQHYTEQLVRLPHLSMAWDRPTTPPLLEREAFGLPREGRVYGCLQPLFTLHPEFDAILRGILRTDPHGTVALLSGKHAYWEVLLRQRFATTLADVLGRIQFLPPLNHQQVLQAQLLCDVLLDPLHFGGGQGSLEALALGVPLVTLPGPFLRGRITAALYRRMEATDCVVDSPQAYIDRAVQLGTDTAYRAEVSARIRAAGDGLFEDCTGIRELEEFLQQAVAKARGR